ncbi:MULTISPECIES: YhcH/YjgK/YiaL family protein [Streptococcus]|uniref:YhcH/YjgK/YiaL family protein n=1 Tax=Streptococcus TaxID=1301 RepID=UPI0008A1CE91|nr:MULTISPECIES: YhcH/YjgK/YiaL family protein [Streptococcus]OFP44170.1 beta-galactosidase [Streptococcus sp. HMSC066E07]RHE86229.1 DUF386 domain-containing protein [Streptococcus anginosus]
MIFDELENLAHYKGIHEHLDCAIDYLLTHDVNDYDSGRYEIDGEKVFLFVQENELNQEENDEFEFHHRYLDLHFLLAGHEIIQYGTRVKEVRKSYDKKKDIGFVTCEQLYPLYLGKQNFAAFLPNEPHQPNRFAAKGDKVKKCVVKVLLND